jgi:aryl-alcohol dehydrogenase-like predicted oxidoreductase
MSVRGNQVKLTAVEQLTALAAEVGMPLSHLATAFARSHPAVTSVLIGPRRPEHLNDLLAAADVKLDDDILDRIDQIVPPGVNLNQDDIYNDVPALADKRLRGR